MTLELRSSRNYKQIFRKQVGLNARWNVIKLKLNKIFYKNIRVILKDATVATVLRALIARHFLMLGYLPFRSNPVIYAILNFWGCFADTRAKIDAPITFELIGLHSL